MYAHAARTAIQERLACQLHIQVTGHRPVQPWLMAHGCGWGRLPSKAGPVNFILPLCFCLLCLTDHDQGIPVCRMFFLAAIQVLCIMLAVSRFDFEDSVILR